MKINEIKKYTNLNMLILFLVFILLFFSEILIAKNPKFGFLSHLVFMAFLIFLSLFLYKKSFELRQTSLKIAWELESLSTFLKTLILLPLIRIVGFSLPINESERAYSTVLISVPMFIAIFLLKKNLKIGRKNLGLTFPINNEKNFFFVTIQILVALTGIPLGFFEYAILQPMPLVSLTFENLLIFSFIFLISVGFLEELIFRGLIQKKAEELFGMRKGLFIATFLFMIMHLSYNSFFYLTFTFFVGIFYGYVFQKTKNLFGISFSHGLINIIMFLVAPSFV